MVEMSNVTKIKRAQPFGVKYISSRFSGPIIFSLTVKLIDRDILHMFLLDGISCVLMNFFIIFKLMFLFISNHIFHSKEINY